LVAARGARTLFEFIGISCIIVLLSLTASIPLPSSNSSVFVWATLARRPPFQVRLAFELFAKDRFDQFYDNPQRKFRVYTIEVFKSTFNLRRN